MWRLLEIVIDDDGEEIVEEMNIAYSPHIIHSFTNSNQMKISGIYG